MSHALPPPAPGVPAGADELTRRVAELERSEAALREQVVLLQAVLDHLPYAIYWKDPRLVYQGCNRRFADDLGLPAPAAIVGQTDASLPWQPGEAAAFEAADRRLLDTRAAVYDDSETVIHPDGRQEWFETHKIPIAGADGALLGIVLTYSNITARKQAEATIRAQAALLEELAAPVIPLSDRVLVMPLVGAIDTRRAQQVITTALEQASAAHADALLLDITGVPVIDTQVAFALIQTAQALRLLGAQVVLTGIRPEVAQSLVGLGVALHDVVTFSTLERGLAYVLRAPGQRG